MWPIFEMSVFRVGLSQTLPHLTYMKFRITCIAVLTTLGLGCSHAVKEHSVVNSLDNVAGLNSGAACSLSASVTIKLGMTEESVANELVKLNAEDISAGMSATKSSPKSHWMWTLESPNVSLETIFRDGKLVRLSIWDWRTRKMTSYHHAMEHDEIARLTIHPSGEFQMDIVETHNNAKN